jgi:hypothetical protein
VNIKIKIASHPKIHFPAIEARHRNLCVLLSVLRRRSQQDSRTSGLASAESRVAHKDTCRSGRAERSAPREARGTIASHDDGGATSLTYTVGCWACQGRLGEEKNGRGRGGNSFELHC